MSTSLIQSQVRHGDSWFYVSTINRKSSAAIAYGSTYSETLAWEFDPVAKTRGGIVAQDESATDSLAGHFRVCEKLAKGGAA